jgi:hypothetical protein
MLAAAHVVSDGAQHCVALQLLPAHTVLAALGINDVPVL